MKETLNYIEVLLWGYGGFAPMSLNVDYNKSIEQLGERLQALESLNYGKMFDEATSANGKANLQRWQATGDSIEYKLPFMKNGQELVSKHIPEMFIAYKQGADRYKADGVWTDEQWREYRVTLSIIEKAFEDRIREFATAYDYPLSDVPNSPEPQQKDLHYYCSKAIEKGYLVKTDGGYRRTNEWTKAQLAYFLNHFPNADKTFPDKKYCVMFGESRLSKAADQLNININGGGKPRGYEIVDELLQE